MSHSISISATFVSFVKRIQFLHKYFILVFIKWYSDYNHAFESENNKNTKLRFRQAHGHLNLRVININERSCFS